MKRNKVQGNGHLIATLLYGPPKADPDGQTSLPLEGQEPAEEESEKDNPAE